MDNRPAFRTLEDSYRYGNTPSYQARSTTGYTNTEQFKAFWNHENIIGSEFANREDTFVDPLWNFSEHLKGLNLDKEEEMEMWALGYNTKSLAQWESRLANKRRQEFERNVMQSTGGWEALGYGAFSGIADPVTLASMVFLTPALAIPGRVMSSAVRVGSMAAGEQLFLEGILSAQQGDARPASETALNVAGGFLLGNVLGGASGALMRGLTDPETTKAILGRALAQEAEHARTGDRPFTYESGDQIDFTATTDPVALRALDTATQIEGTSLARRIGMSFMNDIMRLQLSRSPLVRKIGQHLQSIEGLMKTDVTGTSARPVAPAGPAIEAFRQEFARRFYDLQLSSFKAYQESIGKGATAQAVARQISVQDMMSHNSRMGELFLIYDGTPESLMGVTLRHSNESGDFAWAKASLDEFIDVTEQYQFKLFTRGGFIREFQRMIFGSKSKDIDAAKSEISDLSKAEVEDSISYQARFEEQAKEFDKELINVQRGAAKREAQLNSDLKARIKLGKEQLKTKELEVERATLEKERALDEFDRASVVIRDEILSGQRNVRRTRKYDGQLNTREQEILRQKMLRKDQRRSLEAKHDKKIQEIYKKARKDAESLRAASAKARTKADAVNAAELERFNQRKAVQEQRLKAEQERARQERMAKQQELEEGIKLMEALIKGDYKLAKPLMARFHGERRYRPQIYNVAALKNSGFEVFFQTIVPARISWLKRQLQQGYGSASEIRRWESDLQKLSDMRDPELVEIYSKIYKDLIDDNTFDNNFQNSSGGSLKSKTSGSLQSRHLMYDQTMMAEFLENDIQALFGRHFATVIPETELRARGMWEGDDISKAFEEISKEYRVMMDEVDVDPTLSERKRVKRIKKLQGDERRAKKAIGNILRTLRNEDYADTAQWHKEVVFWVNAINGMRTLGGVLPASLSDLTMAVGKVGAKGMSKAMKSFRKQISLDLAGASREEIGKMMGIFEYGTFSAMTKAVEADDLGINQSLASQYLGKIQSLFYKSTGIIHWNQIMKEMSAYAAMDRVIEGAIGRTLSDKDYMWLSRDGWNSERLQAVLDLWEMRDVNGDRLYGVELEGGAKIIDFAKIRRHAMEAEDPTEIMDLVRLSDDFSASMNRVADRAVVTPQAGDLPDFVSHGPYMKLITSLKSFGLASLNKTTMPMIGGMKNGDGGLASWTVASIFVGTGTYMLRQWFYNEPISENPQTLFWEGFNRSGLLGIYNQGLQMSQTMTNNFFGIGEAAGFQLPSRYFARGALTDLFGPTFGLLESGAAVANVYSRAASGEEVSKSEYMKAARIAPFNNLFYLRAAFSRMDMFE